MANAAAHRLAEESLEPAGVMLAPVFCCRISSQNLVARSAKQDTKILTSPLRST